MIEFEKDKNKAISNLEVFKLIKKNDIWNLEIDDQEEGKRFNLGKITFENKVTGKNSTKAVYNILETIQKEYEQGKTDIDLNKKLSLATLKIILNDKVNINVHSPEKFLHFVILKNIYKKENGWDSEYSIYNNSDRPDFGYAVDKDTIAYVEVKSFSGELGKKDFNKKKKELSEQLSKYAVLYSNHNSDKKPTIEAQGILANGNYLLNNPHLADNSSLYMSENEEFFQTYNYTVNLQSEDIKNDETQIPNIENFLVESKGLIDILPVEYYRKDERFNEISILVNPQTLTSLNRESNPREEKINSSLSLVESILGDINNDLEHGEEYFANSYTLEKQINVLKKLQVYQDDDNSYIYGIGLSLANGQHSTSAYSIIRSMFEMLPSQFKNNFIPQLIENGYDKSIKNRFESTFEQVQRVRKNLGLKNNFYDQLLNVDGLTESDLLNENSRMTTEEMFQYEKKRQNLMNNLNLKTKILIAQNKEQEIAYARASNTTTGQVQDETRIRPLIARINHELIENNRKIQFKYDRLSQINGYTYLDSELLFSISHLMYSSADDPFSMYRQSGKSYFNSFQNRMYKLNVDGEAQPVTLKNLKGKLKKISQQIQIEEDEKNSNQIKLDSQNDAYIAARYEEKIQKNISTIQDLKEEERETKKQIESYHIRISNDDIDEKKHDEFFNDGVLIFDEIYQKNINKNDKKLITSRLAFRFFHDIKSKHEELFNEYDKEILIDNCVKIGQFIGDGDENRLQKKLYEAGINANNNSLFNQTEPSKLIYKNCINEIKNKEDFNVDRLISNIVTSLKESGKVQETHEISNIKENNENLYNDEDTYENKEEREMTP